MMSIDELVKKWFGNIVNGYTDPFTGESVLQDEAIARFLSDVDFTPQGILHRSQEDGL